MGGGGGHSDASSIRFHTKQWEAVGSSEQQQSSLLSDLVTGSSISSLTF